MENRLESNIEKTYFLNIFAKLLSALSKNVSHPVSGGGMNN
jgi:hypothetical protein